MEKSFYVRTFRRYVFCNEKYAWKYLHASEQGRQTLPGSSYFNKIQSFGENHCLLGEKYIEFVKFSCSDEPDKCENCSTHSWVGPPCVRIPQPYPDCEADGNYHYRNVFDTPTHVDGKERTTDDFQSRKQAKDYMAEGRLGTNEEIKQFSKTFIVDEVLVPIYIDHLKHLEINKKKRAAEKRQLKKQQQSNKSMRIITGLPCLTMVF